MTKEKSWRKYDDIIDGKRVLRDDQVVFAPGNDSISKLYSLRSSESRDICHIA